MKVRYSTNWMGPISSNWIKKNGDNWAAGRIDVYGDGVPEYEEIYLPLMKSDDWNRLTVWLNSLVTPEIWTLEDLVRAYETYNPRINWYIRLEE